MIEELFANLDEIIFIPYARPGGIFHDEYTAKAAHFFSTADIRVKGLHAFSNPAYAITTFPGAYSVVILL